MPLAVVIAAATGAAGLAAVVAIGLSLAATGWSPDHVTGAMALAAAVVAVSALTAAGVAALVGRALEIVRADAVAALSADPDHRRVLGRRGATPVATPVAAPVATIATTESGGLARAVQALRLRVRVADEMALRHRRTAETTGAGMFELLSGLVDAEEGARGQLAAELHDTAAQSLALASSLLTVAVTPAEVAQAAGLVDEAEEQVRAVMARTRPPALREGDLGAAVGVLAADLRQRYGLRVTVSWPAGPQPLPLGTAVIVYRFFQEALLNVVKHCEVDVASAVLAVEPDRIVARVRDQGGGFDPDAVRADRGRHVGLDLLRQRARLAGGSMRVRSTRGAGTELELRLPRGTSVSLVGESLVGERCAGPVGDDRA